MGEFLDLSQKIQLKGRILAVKRDDEDMQSIVRYRVEINRNDSGDVDYSRVEVASGSVAKSVANVAFLF